MKNTFLLLTLTCLVFAIQAQPGSLLSAKKIGADNSFQFFDTLDNHFKFGRSLCNLGDLDGDGVSDIAVGVVDQNISSGVVYILFLNSNAGVKSYKRITKNENGLNTASPNAFTEFGQSIVNLGDLDGDGVIDIAVGNKGSNFGGEIYILFLNSNGTVKNHSRIASNVGGFNTSLATNQQFSSSIANIGDIDGDGVIDLAAGNYKDNDGGIDKGSVYILFLNSNGTVKKFQKISQLSGGFSGTLGPDSKFGYSVCSYKEKSIIVGAITDSSVNGFKGAIWIIEIDTNGMVQANLKINDASIGFNDTLSNSPSFGSSIANIGDIDGDGNSEIAIGAFNYTDSTFRSGLVYILSFDSSLNIKSLIRYSNSVGNLPFNFDEYASFGSSISGIGDFNGDKKLDIMVGSMGENAPSQFQKGRLNLLFLDGIEHDLSISKLSANNRSVSVYPNPADSKIKVAINNCTLYQVIVQITDVSGKICLSLQNFDLSNEIDVSMLKAGVYFIRLQTIEGVFQTKLIVQQ